MCRLREERAEQDTVPVDVVPKLLFVYQYEKLANEQDVPHGTIEWGCSETGKAEGIEGKANEPQRAW